MEWSERKIERKKTKALKWEVDWLTIHLEKGMGVFAGGWVEWGTAASVLFSKC